jgi:transposase-like protein
MGKPPKTGMRPMWKCPKCGRAFVVRNVEHTCRVLPVEAHLRGKGRRVVGLYRKLARIIRAAAGGRAETIATKAGISFRGRVGFAWVRVLRERLDVGLLLPMVLRSPRVKKIFTQSQRSHVHSFDLRAPEDLDGEFTGWLREAWRAGQQLQLREPGSWDAAKEIPESAAPARGRLKPRPLWRCPKCGKHYVTRNLWHSCRRITEAEALEGKTEHAVWLYRRLVKMLRECGPVLINPGKTGIAFQGRMRFGGVNLGRDCVRLGFILTRRLDSPRITKMVAYGPRAFGHHVVLRSAEDLDAELAAWLAETYRVGMQEHLLRQEPGRAAEP